MICVIYVIGDLYDLCDLCDVICVIYVILLRSLMLRTSYVIGVMRIKDKGDKALNQIAINRQEII